MTKSKGANIPQEETSPGKNYCAACGEAGAEWLMNGRLKVHEGACLRIMRSPLDPTRLERLP